MNKLRVSKTQLKTKFNNYINKNIDICLSIIKIENFVNRYYVLNSKCIEDYINGERNTNRIVLVLISRIILLIFLLKHLFCAISNSKELFSIACNSNYLLGNSRIISFMIFMTVFTVFLIGIVFLFQEMNRNSYILEFLNDLKHNKCVIILNNLNAFKYNLKIKLMVKLLFNYVYYSQVLVVSNLFCISLIIAYFDTNSGYILMNVIFWIFITIFNYTLFYAIVMYIIIIWYLITLLLKYRFSEINTELNTCLRINDINGVIYAIENHNLVEVITHKLNVFFNTLMFILYYMATPALQLVFYVSHQKDTYFYARFVAAFVSVIIYSLIFSMNLLSAQVISASHKSYPILYSFLVRNNMSIIQRLKIMSFIEKLSGPDIGFYCLDMFPMNNFEFFQYLRISAFNYILLLSLINNII